MLLAPFAAPAAIAAAIAAAVDEGAAVSKTKFFFIPISTFFCSFLLPFHFMHFHAVIAIYLYTYVRTYMANACFFKVA